MHDTHLWGREMIEHKSRDKISDKEEECVTQNDFAHPLAVLIKLVVACKHQTLITFKKKMLMSF